jgi:hypothetical protein
MSRRDWALVFVWVWMLAILGAAVVMALYSVPPT